MIPREATSFDTVHTSGASSIFTTADDDGDVFSSSDTSMLSSRSLRQKIEDYEGPSTQDLHETIANGSEDVRKSFDGSWAESSSGDLIQDALEKSFKRRAQLPPEVPFWLCWEVHRLADVLSESPPSKNSGQFPKTCFEIPPEQSLRSRRFPIG
jgi:hypothetical protein